MRIILTSVATLFVIGAIAQLFAIGKHPETVHTVSEEIVALEAALEHLAAAQPAATTTVVALEATTTTPETTESVPASDTAPPSPPVPAPESSPEDQKAQLIAQIKQLEGNLSALLNEDSQPYIEIRNPTGFVNSEPFRLADFIGEKVILLKFTTYSCHNCQATYPYVIEWYETYKDQGLAVVAIHTPEFSFEKDINNVRAAMEREGIEFPVVLDNNYATWHAYGNRYWPRVYLIDINGNIVYNHIGEGAYDTTERVIQELLKEV